MITRGSIIAALIVVELAIVGEAFVAVHGDRSRPSIAPFAQAQTAPGTPLREGAPHQVYHAGAHPALTVDIGYADLTILAGTASQIEVSLSPTTSPGMFNSTAPITARKDGETIRVAASTGRRWSTGDDRMVTVLVPPGTEVTVVNAGDIKAQGLRADASFHSVGQGSVTLEDYDAPTLHVESGGRINATALRVRNGSVEGDSRVTLGFAAGANTLVTAATDSGRITVSGFPAGATGTAVHKSSDGDDDVSQSVRIGSGSGHLDVHASDGNINLAQEG